MPRRSLFVLIALMGFAPAVHAATPQQLCESAMELASAKYAQCRLNAESKYSKTLDAAKRTAAYAKCSANLGTAFSKATAKYGVACAATEPSSAFDDYLEQCSDDASAAAAGAALPDYVGELASCNADLTACNGDLSTCTGDLATANADLATCEGDLAACEALPPARLLKTGQTTAYGAGSDGNLQKGIAQGYVDNGDGTITDTSTGLMWEKKSDDGTIHDKDNTYTWSGASYGTTHVLDGTAATTFLAALNAGGGFAGHTDWRLPNQTELYSLVNLQAVSPATFPAFNTGCAPACTVLTCSCTVPYVYWSSSTYASLPQYAWFVFFLDGDTGANGKDYNFYVRAVRGGS
ncbi:DUF1566 domain-containing protein [Candidatus Binatia bacterium]|nr:DUF1566 domain-containing protein [Candidatus Binatia bacterium]